jgi:hypothetical protein
LRITNVSAHVFGSGAHNPVTVSHEAPAEQSELDTQVEAHHLLALSHPSGAHGAATASVQLPPLQMETWTTERAQVVVTVEPSGTGMYGLRGPTRRTGRTGIGGAGVRGTSARAVPSPGAGPDPAAIPTRTTVAMQIVATLARTIRPPVRSSSARCWARACR